jgi:hypothetical protein
MKRKLGINIDGVIRNFLERFEKVYISTYIHNETLVETAEDGGMKVLTDEEDEVRALSIEKRIDDMITYPIDSFDLMNHFKFEAGKNYLGDEVSAEKMFNEFINELKAYQIFGQANAYQWSIDSAHRLQQLGTDEDLFDVVLLSTLRGKAISATYSFLSSIGCRIKSVVFLDEDFDKWDHCDAIIDIMPETFQSKPEEDCLSIKINHEFNKWDEADLSYDTMRDLFHKKNEDGNPEFIEKLREFYKK